MEKNLDPLRKKIFHPGFTKSEIEEVLRSLQVISREIEKLTFEKERIRSK